MSTVLLMTDSWQPTVLRLVPFSQNNAKHPNTSRTVRGENSAKTFPVLAVTRMGKTDKMVKANSPDSRQTPCRSASSSRSENLTDVDTAKSEVSVATAKESVYTNFTRTTEDADDTQTHKHRHIKRYQKKRVPKSHTDMTEAIKFPVQDLNEQISSTSSFKSAESANDSKTKTNTVNKVDNTRTKLPKPSLCPSPDVKLHSPINGVRRSVPLTPGELELKRIRESYMLEQSQRGKKYKLNVNQLPRSTTPINDHDPDKLNMKQVIAFLQTKATRDTQKKPKDTKSQHPRIAKINANQCAKVSLRSAASNDTLPARSQTSADNNDKHTQGRASVLSTKSTPNFYTGKHAERYPNSMSSRSYIERSSSKRAGHGRARKPMKEFKLYRFLTVAPDGKQQGLATTVTDTLPNTEATNLTVTQLNNVKPAVQNEKKAFLKKSYRSSTTANLLHRRAARKNTPTPTNNDEKENEPTQGTIRLPSVTHDHDHHEYARHSPEVNGDDEDSDTCSTTSATCNSIKNSVYKEDRSQYPKKGKSLTFFEDRESDPKQARTNEGETDMVDNESQPVVKNSFMARMYTNPDFPRVNIGQLSGHISEPRQIKVNMPQENRNGYSQEIVRLTLRHEKNATRVTSYMSDMQSEKWPQKTGFESEGLNGTVHFNQVRPMDSTLSYSSHKDLYDSPKQIMNSISNNHFIKVRQKLKSTLHDNE